MRIIVCGGRNFSNKALLWKALNRAHARWNITAVIHGAATGADMLAKQWAREKGIDDLPYPADWKRHGKGAGPVRNREMLREAEPAMVIAFPGGNGTAHMVRIADEAGLTVYQVGW